MNQPIKVTFPSVTCICQSDSRVFLRGTTRTRLRFTSRKRTKEYRLGLADRLAGKPCGSAAGRYLDGWYSIPNLKNPKP